jgi:hypothetical protein
MSNDNYRNVYKSDHLGAVDLEEFIEAGRPLVFVIKEVKQEIGAKVAGKKGDFNIAYFHEGIKPWVLNSGNAKIIRSFAGKSATNSVSTWKDIPVELYVDYNVKFGSDTVSGVRVKPTKPAMTPKAKPVFTEANFDKAFNAGATVEKIKQVYDISEDMAILYNDYVLEHQNGAV